MKPELNPRKVMNRLKSEGWQEVRISGSHHIFDHSERRELVVVPVHGSRDLTPGVARSIAKKAGWKD